MNYTEIKKRAIINAMKFERNNYLLSERLNSSFGAILSIIDEYLEDAIKKKTKDDVILRRVDSIIKREYEKLDREYVENISEIATSEYRTNVALIAASVATANTSRKFKVTDNYKKKAIFSREQILNNKFFTVEFAKYKKELELSIMKRVRASLITRRDFKVTAKLIYNDISLKTNLKYGQVKTISRTMMKSIQSDAVEKSLSDNNIQYVKYVSILDNRTTDACKDLSNKVFNIKDAPKLPLHYNCRATLIMVAPWDVEEAKEDLISFKEWYDKNKDDPDLKRLRYVY